MTIFDSNFSFIFLQPSYCHYLYLLNYSLILKTFFSYIFQLQASKKSNSAEDSPTSKQQTSQADLQSQVINNGGGLRKGGFSSTPDLKSSTNVPLIPLEELKVKIGVKTSAKTDLDLTLHHHMQVTISGLTTFLISGFLDNGYHE